ncbi:YbaK/EbsC family protein [Candidatus Nanohalovita haloferacivicina]|uniref:YbaK/EbsC family protein n=1 Tax=Candidatus Nanohalovita haloferacivicina TaxID=2978046 RepID=UPI00325FB4FA|nr:Cys-tRNA(Pro) deacylase, prolyl-tRNA editing enzyme YbaK/EbsC [Candidatus Nanohalobia archaeon BNXNv]
MHPTAEKFLDKAEKEYDFSPEIKEFPEGTKTAEDAANAINCEIGQIVKSLVFESEKGLYLVLCSGENSVDTEKLAMRTSSQNIGMASPDTVKEATGWSIGGVPPLNSEMEVFIDDSLLDYDTVWAAAGTPEAVFSIGPDRLVSLSEASIETFFD